MKCAPRFLILLASVILAGGYTGHRLALKDPAESRQAAPGDFRPRLLTKTGRAAAGAQSQDALSGDSAWLEEAFSLAADGGGAFDLAMDAPHLLLTLAGRSRGEFPAIMAAVMRRPEGKARTLLEDWVLTEWLKCAPADALAWTVKHRPDSYPAAVRALALVDAAAAWQALQTRPVSKETEGDLTMVIFSNWTAQDRMAALDALLQLDPAGGDLPFRAGLGFQSTVLPLRNADPAAWAAARDAVAERILQEKDLKVRIGAIGSLLLKIEADLENEPRASRRDQLAGWLRSLPLADEELGSLLISVAQHDGARPDYAPEAFPWLWEAAPAGQRVQVLKSIMEYWASPNPWSAKDPDACGKWLNTQLPFGPEHAEALKSFAVHTAEKDPDAGLAWAQSNPDPAMRAEALKTVHGIILQQWPHRAEALGVSAE